MKREKSNEEKERREKGSEKKHLLSDSKGLLLMFFLINSQGNKNPKYSRSYAHFNGPEITFF
jgi:hypothetical protein|tara:strand:+ start:538 stop:723 length:186 start_codon:yes stop_codon:yes gene_type:complete